MSNIWTCWHCVAILDIVPIVFTHDVIIFVIFVFWQRQGTNPSTEHEGTTLCSNKYISQALWNMLTCLSIIFFNDFAVIAPRLGKISSAKGTTDEASYLWYFLKAARQSPNHPHFSQPSPTLQSWNFLLMAECKHPLFYSKPTLKMSTSRRKKQDCIKTERHYDGFW